MHKEILNRHYQQKPNNSTRFIFSIRALKEIIIEISEYKSLKSFVEKLQTKLKLFCEYDSGEKDECYYSLHVIKDIEMIALILCDCGYEKFSRDILDITVDLKKLLRQKAKSHGSRNT